MTTNTERMLKDLKGAFQTISNTTEDLKKKSLNSELDTYQLAQLNYYLDKIYLATEDLGRALNNNIIGE